MYQHELNKNIAVVIPLKLEFSVKQDQPSRPQEYLPKLYFIRDIHT